MFESFSNWNSTSLAATPWNAFCTPYLYRPVQVIQKNAELSGFDVRKAERCRFHCLSSAENRHAMLGTDIEVLYFDGLFLRPWTQCLCVNLECVFLSITADGTPAHHTSAFNGFWQRINTD